jgi:hypothetical protein
MASNTEMEQRWIDAWNQAYDIAGHDTRAMACQLPDGTVVGFRECLGWLQDSAYEGYFLHLVGGWVGHRRGIVVRRSRTAAQSAS